MKNLALLIATLIPLAACQSTTAPAPIQTPPMDTYSTSKIHQPMGVNQACTVVDARYVRLQDDSARALQREQNSQLVGLAAGAVIGGALGNEIGGGDGRKVATVLGTLAGASIGANAGANAARSRAQSVGVEYTLNLGGRHGSGMRSIVQPISQGEYVLPPGSPCRVVGNDWQARVQPL